MTIEAFADTIIPGEKRSLDDRAVAGAATGAGAVSAGALTLLTLPEVGLAPVLGHLADSLNAHARTYAAGLGRECDSSVPAFVALSFEDRTALVRALTAPDHPEKEVWVGIAIFSNMAYDSAAHLHTDRALANGHPGLTAMGFATPDRDGLWRFPDHTYGRQLAPLHPLTTESGSPA